MGTIYALLAGESDVNPAEVGQALLVSYSQHESALGEFSPKKLSSGRSHLGQTAWLADFKKSLADALDKGLPYEQRQRLELGAEEYLRDLNRRVEPSGSLSGIIAGVSRIHYSQIDRPSPWEKRTAEHLGKVVCQAMVLNAPTDEKEELSSMFGALTALYLRGKREGY